MLRAVSAAGTGLTLRDFSEDTVDRGLQVE